MGRSSRTARSSLPPLHRNTGAKPLRGEMAGAFRVRTGVYRIVFRPHGDRVVIEAIGHRKDFYED